ncbi:MAG: hypothetical protein NVV74_04580 [Magnetospirillum sp.]|nr:hypothetical protein [Magnetospirillum sp.]
MARKAFLKANCVTCRAIKQVFDGGYKGAVEGGLPAYFRNYDPEFAATDKDMGTAWSTTLDAISGLAQDAQAAGSKLVVVHIPSHIELTDDIKRDFGHRAIDTAGFAKLQPSYVRNRLQSNLDALGIEYIDLKAVMMQYRDRFALGAPMFTFSCDKHFNPLGHLVFSAGLAIELAKRHPDVFPAQAAEQGRAILESSPEQLVGKDMMDALAQGRPFRTQR